jgi:hypothetical protein
VWVLGVADRETNKNLLETKKAPVYNKMPKGNSDQWRRSKRLLLQNQKSAVPSSSSTTSDGALEKETESFKKALIPKKSFAHRILEHSLSYSTYPVNMMKKASKMLPPVSKRIVRRIKIPLKKPPQFVRWDLLGVFFSYMWGFVNSRPLPSMLRSPVYKGFFLEK